MKRKSATSNGSGQILVRCHAVLDPNCIGCIAYDQARSISDPSAQYAAARQHQRRR